LTRSACCKIRRRELEGLTQRVLIDGPRRDDDAVGETIQIALAAVDDEPWARRPGQIVRVQIIGRAVDPVRSRVDMATENWTSPPTVVLVAVKIAVSPGL